MLCINKHTKIIIHKHDVEMTTIISLLIYFNVICGSRIRCAYLTGDKYVFLGNVYKKHSIVEN